MPRLIDADALMEHFTDMQNYEEECACNFLDRGQEPSTEWYCVESAVENAPTIDAIPVKWMENLMNECALSDPDLNNAIFAVLVKWTKEQKEAGRYE